MRTYTYDHIHGYTVGIVTALFLLEIWLFPLIRP
jgi:hypothetical protein